MTPNGALLADRLRRAAHTMPIPASLIEDVVGTAVATKRRRDRSRSAGLIALAACVAAALVVGVTLVSGRMQTAPPADRPTPTPTATETQEPNPEGGPVTREIIQERWTATRAEGLEWMPSALPQLLDPDWSNDPPLSSNPVTRVMAAVERDVADVPQISVLGDDGVWRSLDVGNLVQSQDSGGYTSTALQPSSIAPDQRRLAIPQPQAVVIVDLTDATVRRFSVPGFNKTVAWTPDSEAVLVGTEGRQRGVIMDVQDGSTIRVPFSSNRTTYASNGSAIELSETQVTQLRTYVDNTEAQSIPLMVGAQSGINSNLTAVATEQSVAMVRSVVAWQNGRSLTDRDGPLVVDTETGDPIALIPMYDYGTLYATSPLGWLNQDTVIYRIGGDVIAWTYRTGQLQRVTELPDSGLDGGANGLATVALATTALK